MKRLEDAGASCFVLDLRDNRGGLVQVLSFSDMLSFNRSALKFLEHRFCDIV